ncbi:hypothetical protein GQR58_000809 [Nymphon striatum]|nr:hypothetical protein GQR58_000809 [Nymphon striatum]
MDHINNARWLLVHIYDLHNLPSKIEDEFIKGSWVVSRSQRSFSSIPIDQCHEQLNKHINGVGGAVGLMNDPAAERASAKTFMNTQSNYPILQKREATFFFEICPELITLGTGECASDSAIDQLRILESTVKQQYSTFVQEVLIDSSRSIHVPLKKSFLHVFKEKKHRQADKAQGLLVFHAITGSDTASAFANKGKLSSWKAWSAVTETGNLTLHLMYQIKSIVKAICRLCDKQNTKFVPVGYQMQCILIPFPLVICGLR